MSTELFRQKWTLFKNEHESGALSRPKEMAVFICEDCIHEHELWIVPNRDRSYRFLIFWDHLTGERVV